MAYVNQSNSITTHTPREREWVRELNELVYLFHIFIIKSLSLSLSPSLSIPLILELIFFHACHVHLRCILYASCLIAECRHAWCTTFSLFLFFFFFFYLKLVEKLVGRINVSHLVHACSVQLTYAYYIHVSVMPRLICIKKFFWKFRFDMLMESNAHNATIVMEWDAPRIRGVQGWASCAKWCFHNKSVLPLCTRSFIFFSIAISIVSMNKRKHACVFVCVCVYVFERIWIKTNNQSRTVTE